MTTTDTIPTIEREIKYSRQDRDYACYVNGQYIGSRANYSEAETLCDQVAYDLIADGQCATATELDGGSEPDAMVADHAVVAPACDPIITCEDDDCTDDAMHIVAGAKLCCWHFAEATGYVCDYSGDHVDTCYVCGSAAWKLTVHGPLCPSHAAAYNERQSETNPPILAPALLAEADAALSTCPGAFDVCGAEAHPSYAPFCQRCARVLDRLAVEAYVQRLADDLGLSCSFCGEAHGAADCPLRRPLIVPGPRVCGCCGGAHHIQQCGELRAALFAKAEVFY